MSRPHAIIRSVIDDFQVVEIPKVFPSGSGEHLLVEVRKRGANTAWVAQQLAAWAGVPTRAVSWAGLKDRHAVTEQWFSIHVSKVDPDPGAFACAGVELLSVHRHARKLQRGALAGNRFRIVLRGLAGQADAIAARVPDLSRGVPNRFGVQRFGRGGGNPAQARAWLLDGRKPRDRHQRGILLSAARSELFNAVLDARIADGTWAEVIEGEVVNLDGSGSCFTGPVDDVLRARCVDGDVHPTGPLPGRGGTRPSGRAADIENAALAPYADLVAALERVAEADRRPLRMRPGELAIEVIDSDTAALSFSLPPGAYATTLLDELVEWTEESFDAGTDRA